MMKKYLSERIYMCIADKGPSLSTGQLYTRLNVDIFTLQDTLRVMRDRGVIASVNRTWYLRKNSYARLP